jgi:hypothetical protein
MKAAVTGTLINASLTLSQYQFVLSLCHMRNSPSKGIVFLRSKIREQPV